MELRQIMEQRNFVVVGNTVVEDKYAYKIKKGLVETGYNVSCVGKELKTINDVDFEIDVLDMCINPVVGLSLLKECNKNIKTVVIQPGAGSEEILSYLQENSIDFIEGCLLIGLSLYKNYKVKE